MFGTSPGRRGQVLETPAGTIPVYNNVREGLDAGHKFNVGVVYLPPAAVRDGVFELIRVNRDIEKIVILTEKMSVHDAREIRALAQQRTVDIFGANCLGVADAWNHIRIGGALGGDKPDEIPAQGFGRDLLQLRQLHHHHRQLPGRWRLGHDHRISSGKDVYIHFAPPEFAHAFDNDARTKAAVMYVEPGGYYEQDLHIQQAGGGLRGRPLEGQADARGRPCRRHGRLGRQRRGQGEVVHEER